MKTFISTAPGGPFIIEALDIHAAEEYLLQKVGDKGSTRLVLPYEAHLYAEYEKITVKKTFVEIKRKKEKK